jgi:hypothetical protein
MRVFIAGHHQDTCVEQPDTVSEHKLMPTGGLAVFSLCAGEGAVLEHPANRRRFVWAKEWGTQLVDALRYKPEGRGFDSRWYHWNFSLT